jgi:hypothetical protein
MPRTQDGSGYGLFGASRREGPTLASRRGAAAILVRSIGTDYHRNPHTGVQNFAEGVRPSLPGALALSDAEQLQRVLARAPAAPVRLRLVMTAAPDRARQSGNVIAEVPGSDPSAGTILIGGHLDSWDLGTGAFDNAAGVAITTAAAHRVMRAASRGAPYASVMFGAEEVGLFGGNDLFARHRQANDVVMVAESDFGADRVWRAAFNRRPANQALAARIAPRSPRSASCRAASRPERERTSAPGRAPAWRRSTSTRTAPAISTITTPPTTRSTRSIPAQLRQNVAAWTAMLSEVANAPERSRRCRRPRSAEAVPRRAEAIAGTR